MKESTPLYNESSDSMVEGIYSVGLCHKLRYPTEHTSKATDIQWVTLKPDMGRNLAKVCTPLVPLNSKIYVD